MPAVNCRHCGETGWTSVLNERDSAVLDDLGTFYNLYFKQDKRVRMMFPFPDGEGPGHRTYRLCVQCLRVQHTSKGDQCSCGGDTVGVYMPELEVTGERYGKSYVCPFCGTAGIAIIGLRSATSISAAFSQVFGSRFNDDKKLLAFSDNVQDAAHRAGFFGSRTWRFVLRTAVQRFALEVGDNLPLKRFVDELVTYWQNKLSREEFITLFIPPNLTWRRAYEQMQKTGQLAHDPEGERLLDYVARRMKYEMLLEYSLTSRRGRTLEKTGCSVLSPDVALLGPALERIFERFRNEFGELRDVEPDAVVHMVSGWLLQMKNDGAIYHDVYEGYIREGARSYMLSQNRIPWMPGVHEGVNTPRFLAPSRADGKFRGLETNSWYCKWLEKHIDAVLVRPNLAFDMARVIIDELLSAGILRQLLGPRGMPVWALAPEAVRVSTRVAHMVCDHCGTVMPVAEDAVNASEGCYCLRRGCYGRLARDETRSLDFYGKLYTHGDLVRIIAREHTGLLERDDKENLEREFKSTGDERKPWHPNLLSSTPTLEMGIDIGDLSTVVLCNVPPGQAQYVQRVGRAGRKDGNALAISVANARPHDLYFWEEPLEMIAGSINPPDIFLNASAVLARQFVAYCMDCWVKSGIPTQAIPRNVGSCLSNLKARRKDAFPFNFLIYVQANLGHLHRTFIDLFSDYLSEASIRELRHFAQGDGASESPMHVQILEAFENLYEQREAIRKNIRQLNRLIRELESKPKDSSHEDELKALDRERRALNAVVRGMNTKDVFNFLSDEGLLPNYAFPEAGIILRAILYRQEEPEEVGGDRKREIMTYE